MPATSASPTPSITPGGVAPSPVYRVEHEHLVLQLWDVGPISANCDVNSFREPGRPLLGAYLDECSDWERNGDPAHLYNVSLINAMEDMFEFDLGNFVVEDTEGKLHRPDGRLGTSGSDLPTSRDVAPEGSVGGWLIVPEPREFVPAAVIFRHPHGDLRIKFHGRHDVRSPP